MLIVEDRADRDSSERALAARRDERAATPAERQWAAAAEARLAALVRSSCVAVVTWTTDGKVVEWNDGAARLFGYSADEVCGRDVGVLSMARERRAFRADGVTACLYDRQLEMRHKQGGAVHVSWTATAALDADGRVIGATGIGTDVSARVRLERELAMTAERQRRQLGTELHDSLGQQLTAIGLLVGTLMVRLEANQAVSDVGRKIERSINAAKTQLCALLRGRAPVGLDAQDLVAALAELARSTQEVHDVACRLDCREPAPLADRFVANQLYLIAREAVHNAVKHGRPRSIAIRLEHVDGVSLTVEDDGPGVGPDAAAAAGLGVRIMQDRCSLIGGTLKIERGAAGGTLLVCRCSDEAVSTRSRATWRGANGLAIGHDLQQA